MATLRDDVEAIYAAAVAAVRVDVATRSKLSVIGDAVDIDGRRFPIGPDGVYAIGIGKAAVGMSETAASVLGDRFTAGLAVTKAEPSSSDTRVTVMYGAHPVPEVRSLEAGEVVLRFAAAVPSGALVLCLISGGGSALVESLRPGVDLQRLREVTQALLRGGASIHELNGVRSRLSEIKAGGLLRALAHTRVCNLIVSDVLGDDVQTIASGPTVPPVVADAGAVLAKYGVSLQLPEAVDSPALESPPTIIAANLSLAIDVAAQAAIERGYTPAVLSRSVDGEAREVGRLFGSILVDSAAGRTAFGERTCIIAGGETTVTVRGSGTGGRNTEAALAAAIRLAGAGGVAAGFLATDGDDGTSGAAGGIVDGATAAGEWGRSAATSLDDNDSYTFLAQRDAVLVTGPTGTNVNDLIIGLVDRYNADRRPAAGLL
jgi:hydroxypyruvate reductase